MFGDANLLRKHTNEYALSRANNETLVRNYRSPVEQEYFQKILELSTRPDGTLNPEIFTVLVEPPDHKSVDKLADVFEEASSKNPYLFIIWHTFYILRYLSKQESKCSNCLQ